MSKSIAASPSKRGWPATTSLLDQTVRRCAWVRRGLGASRSRHRGVGIGGQRELLLGRRKDKAVRRGPAEEAEARVVLVAGKRDAARARDEHRRAAGVVGDIADNEREVFADLHGVGDVLAIGRERELRGARRERKAIPREMMPEKATAGGRSGQRRAGARRGGYASGGLAAASASRCRLAALANG